MYSSVTHHYNVFLQIPSLETSSDKDYNLLINKDVCEGILSVFSIIIEWGCEKQADETYKQYMERENRISSKTLRKLFFGNDLLKLDDTNCDSFEVSFMFKLLPFICDGIEEFNVATWRAAGEDKLEHHLMKLRDFRNCVANEPKGAGLSPDTKNDVLKTTFRVFQIAGKMYSISNEPIKEEKRKFMKKICKILDQFYSQSEVADWENSHVLSL